MSDFFRVESDPPSHGVGKQWYGRGGGGNRGCAEYVYMFMALHSMVSTFVVGVNILINPSFPSTYTPPHPIPPLLVVVVVVVVVVEVEVEVVTPLPVIQKSDACALFRPVTTAEARVWAPGEDREPELKKSNNYYINIGNHMDTVGPNAPG